MSIKVLLVDDHAIMRQGLKVLLDMEQDITVIAEAANGNEAILMARELTPDVIIMDMNMPEVNGIKASRRILEENPSARIIILSMILESSYVRQALKSGVRGYVLKDCVSDELVEAIRSAMLGFHYLCREVSELIIKDYTGIAGEPHNVQPPPLSTRETEVLQLIAEGNNAKEIAFYLGLSVKTVEGHRSNIMKKLNLRSVAEITRYAVREGLIIT